MPQGSDYPESSASIDGVGWSFLVAVGLIPLIYEANVPLAWGINAFAFGLLLVLYLASQATLRRPLPVPIYRIRTAAVAFAVILLWMVLQTQTWMPESLHAPIWRQASGMLGETLPGTISVNPAATKLGLLRLGTAAAVFFLALQLGRDRRWATRIVVCIAVAGTLHAVYAMGLKALGPKTAELILPASLFKLQQAPDLTGTFINRDHFAIYLSLAIVCAWGLLVQNLRAKMAHHGFQDHRETIAKAFDLSAVAGRYAILLMPLAAALLLTTSRAGFFLTFAAVLFLATFEWSLADQSSARLAPMKRGRLAPGAWIPIAIVVVGVLAALVTHGDDLGARLATGNPAADINTRIDVAKITLNAIADRPFVGYGYGTFANVFQVYGDSSLSPMERWQEAHNSYLEALLGLGIPAALILFAGMGLLLFRCLRGAVTRRRDRLSPIVAVAATLVVALHALVDFSIQVEGIALTYAALLGAGCAQSWSSRET